MNESPVFRISRRIDPPITFAIDDQTYELYRLKNLTREQEIRLRSAFQKYSAIQRSIDTADAKTPDHQFEAWAKELLNIELLIITTMTNIPREVAEELDVSSRQELVRHIADEFSRGISGEGA